MLVMLVYAGIKPQLSNLHDPLSSSCSVLFLAVDVNGMAYSEIWELLFYDLLTHTSIAKGNRRFFESSQEHTSLGFRLAIFNIELLFLTLSLWSVSIYDYYEVQCLFTVILNRGQPKTVCDKSLFCAFSACVLVDRHPSLPQFERIKNLTKIMDVWVINIVELG